MHISHVGRVLALALVSAFVIQAQSPAKAAPTTPKRRVAVFEFDNATHTAVSGPYAAILHRSSGPDIGKAAADLLITRLVQNGTVMVIERDALNKLIAEQNLTNSDRTDPRTAAKLGQILGVDAIVLGSVTKYDFDDKTSRTGARAGFMGWGASSGKIKQNMSAHVEINARVVSPDTAEVLNVAQGQGVLERSEKLDYTQVAMMMQGKGGYHDSMLDQAMDTAVSQVAAQLEKTLPAVPIHAVVINGLVADAAESGRLILNVGAQNGVKQGDRVRIWRSGKEIKDPATGRVLTREDTLIGDAEVVQVENAFSVATYKGTAPVKVGDVVKGPLK